MCQGLLPSRRHIEKREDPGDEVALNPFSRDVVKSKMAAVYRSRVFLLGTRVFLVGECVRTVAKTIVVDKKKPEGASSAMFGVGTTAKCCELKRHILRRADLVRWSDQLSVPYVVPTMTVLRID